MLWAAACLAFFTLLRRRGVYCPRQFDIDVRLSVSNVSVNNTHSPSMVFIRLKESKTDQLRKGVTFVLGKTSKPPLCPVSCLLRYLVARGMAPGSLFIWAVA